MRNKYYKVTKSTLRNVQIIRCIKKTPLEQETKGENRLKWEHNLGYEIDLENWKNFWEKNINFTACYLLRENYMKIYHRWYLAPDRLSKMNKTNNNKC